MDKIRNIDELIKLLYNNIGLLSQLYEHRNTFLYKDALDSVDGNSKKLENLFQYGIIEQSDDDVFVHCMIDEVGRLDNVNAAGVLDFANNRKIWIITDAPEPKTLKKYKHTYTLSKDGRGKTHVIRAYSEMP